MRCLKNVYSDFPKKLELMIVRQKRRQDIITGIRGVLYSRSVDLDISN